jgi:hypothetical protein
MPELAQVDSQAVRIRELAAMGKSQRQIEMDVFGYTGGKAHQEVASVLAATTTTMGATGPVAGDL